MHPFEAVNAREPGAEELVRPAMGFENLETENWVVVDGIDDHLHEMDLVGLGPCLTSVNDAHCQLNKEGDVLVNASPEVQHDRLCQFASAYPIDTTNLLVPEDVLDHANDGDGEIEWAEEEVEGALEGDVPDESAAYIDFLNQEVSGTSSLNVRDHS